MRIVKEKVFGGVILFAAFSLAACSQKSSQGYEPGLGEIMSLQQMRHAKLWYAGSARNWPLAVYELDELREGFEDVIHYHPTHKDSPLPLSQVIPKIMDEPLRSLDRAIQAHDPQAFLAAYDAVTAGCNGCHQATNFGFNVVRRPVAPGYSNQDFNPAPPIARSTPSPSPPPEPPSGDTASEVRKPASAGRCRAASYDRDSQLHPP